MQTLDDIETPLEPIEYLVRSPNRVQLLDAIRDEPRTRDGDGTESTLSGATQVTGVLCVLQPLFKRMVHDELRTQLSELKATLEHGTE